MTTSSWLPRAFIVFQTSLLFFSTIAISGAGIAAADDNYGIFTTPIRSGPNEFYEDNPVYQIGTTLQLKWDTGMRTYQLNMWQQWLNETAAIPTSVILLQKASSAVEPKGMTWDVQIYDLDLALSNVFFFGITEDGDLGTGFTSHYFNLTHDTVPATSTSSAPTGTSTGTGAPTPNPSDDSNNGTGLKIGLGVGLGVGIPLVALCAFVAAFLIFRRKRDGNSNNNHNSGSAYEPMMQGYHGPSPGMNSVDPASESRFAPSASVPTYSSYSPYGREPYSNNTAYTPNIPQQLDGTPKEPQQYFSTTPSQHPPSELPGDTLASPTVSPR